MLTSPYQHALRHVLWVSAFLANENTDWFNPGISDSARIHIPTHSTYAFFSKTTQLILSHVIKS